jgi:hypothetical protein
MTTPLRCIRLRIALAFLAAGILLLATIVAIIRHPEPLFPYHAATGNLSLYSDTPFDAQDGIALLEETQSRLQTSPIYDPSRRYRVFVCNNTRHCSLFFLPAPSARGLAYLGSAAVFLCDGDIQHNRIRLPDGTLQTNGPNLAYYAAHEITHVATEAVTGPIDYLLLPNWIREGYADYVARGSLLNDPAMREAFLNNAPEMNFPSRVPYLRYNLLVAHYLENQHMTPRQLFTAAPEQTEAEAELRQVIR